MSRYVIKQIVVGRKSHKSREIYIATKYGNLRKEIETLFLKCED